MNIQKKGKREQAAQRFTDSNRAIYHCTSNGSDLLKNDFGPEQQNMKISSLNIRSQSPLIDIFKPV